MKSSQAYKIYLFSISGMLLFLPLLEAPKQLFLTLALISGFYIIYKYKIAIQKDIITYSIIAFILFSIPGSIFGEYDIHIAKSLKGNLDLIRILILFIVIRAIPIDKESIKRVVIYPIMIGFSITVIWGVYDKIIYDTVSFSLHSVGHRNHSAIYALMVFTLSMVLYFTQQNKTVWLFGMILSIYVIFATGSRAAIYAIPMLLVIYALLSKRVSIKQLSVIFALFSIVGISMIILFPDNFLIYKLKEGLSPAGRFFLSELALRKWIDGNILFGIGAGNYKYINYQEYFQSMPLSHLPSHAHNTLMTYLVERGILATAAYIVFQISLAVKLYINSKESVYTTIALMMLIANTIVSIVNTTFHHENGLLMVTIWAIAINLSQNISDQKSKFR